MVDQLLFHFTAVGHLVEELKAIRPELPGGAWVSSYPCMEEMSQKDLVTSSSLSQSTSFKGGVWHALFFPEGNRLRLDLAGSYHSDLSFFPEVLEGHVSTSTSLSSMADPGVGKSDCFEWGSSPSFSITITWYLSVGQEGTARGWSMDRKREDIWMDVGIFAIKRNLWLDVWCVWSFLKFNAC